jgi:ERCC4-type nuclease
MSERPVIFVDDHEGRSQLVHELTKAGYDVQMETLPVADIMFVGTEKSFLIERKTEKDFTASIVDQRLFLQCRNLAEARQELGYKVFLLLEGAGDNREEMNKMGPDLWRMWRFSGLQAPQILAALVTVIDAFDIKILWSEKPYTTRLLVRALTNMYGKSQTEKKHLFALRQKVKTSATPDEEARYILEGFPGISATRADTILKQFGTVQDAITHIDEWDTIKGIGQKIKDEVYRVVSHKYGTK